jgi:8-oxo-dGTP pyrophosphatase MutT (NUDIX family)
MEKPYRKAVMAVIINDEQKILIGYSPRDKSFKFPRGGLEDHEDTLTGIKRELLEELQYELHDEYIIKVFEEKVNYPFPANDFFSGQELCIVKISHNPVAKVIPQDDEFDKMYWIDTKELKDFNTHYRFEAYQKALIICELL